ncbi:hypothetical protein HNQ94_002102 [Salirhabdus euzebyi]|uniref:N-acetyltransferase domain-containing protein n=1 Tax=Salirhabdus euzebyi TaxID=394506 RepID=A0A841Q5L9_9BACI|nr:GNAT family protein [Salirhabdus euzebyi]MBB6453653.1 hypothetical protein [Salirhabdus euzebyi]
MDYYKVAPTLVGEKVLLRSIDLEKDKVPFHQMFLEPILHEWTGNRVPDNEQESYEQLKAYRDLDFLISWVITDKQTEAFIGTFWIGPSNENGKQIAGDAQRIAKQFWRKGYTKEARQLIYDFAFNELGIEEFHSTAWGNNENSCQSMESVGYRLAKVEEKFFAKKNNYFTEHYYVLTKEAWQKYKGNKVGIR